MWKLFVKANNKENILHSILELNIFWDIPALIDWQASYCERNMTERESQKKDFLWFLREEFTVVKKAWQQVVWTERSHLHPHVWSWCVGGRWRQTETQTQQTGIRKLGPGYKTSETRPPLHYPCSPSDTLSPERLYVLKALQSSPNSAPNWGPNIQIFEPTGGIFSFRLSTKANMSFV